jgi:hypothetical protein
MPLWLSIALAVLAAVLAVGGAMHAMLERQTRLLLSEFGRGLAEHVAECPARSRAYVDPDDSGSVPAAGRKWSASGRLVQP